ncbi:MULTISPECIES: SDR family NAD(P)-dependent oxidoreductase [Rhodococcus erythropolis group]|uniref:SDR family NAD(P)-dependent oxidoreductase n=1 Tax=Rhodococcus erythropolis group TaxID=2840174 RepID=UPI001BEBE9C4|nr:MULTISPECIES: SDR family NAD(P)-dependent oxidoreductase [Rhodococcus erythropolis group]MBT2266042.1 SDR family NAD(P)-dependent oxidoreductase [Rhodococcus erythropolis]MBT2275647.1 SDR family NAD(P)-dependent oxidoreductase [Rhodococcus qingshengii]
MVDSDHREEVGASALLRGAGVVVTGGASGLGAGTVRRLHALGAHVVIADKSIEQATSLADELGERAKAYQCDVTSSEDVAAAISLAAAAPKGLRLAVSCAGIAQSAELIGDGGAAHPLESFEMHLRVNVVGTFNLVRLAAQTMHANKAEAGGERGLIVLTGSVNAFEGAPGEVQYSASKGAVHAMTLPSARELAPWGIRVNTIVPGPFATGMISEPEYQGEYVAKMAFPKRMGRPSEFASLVEELFTNQMINGSVIRVDAAGTFG